MTTTDDSEFYDDVTWREDGRRHGWEVPWKAPRWKRLPIVRHLRAMWLSFKVFRHYTYGLGQLGAFRTGYDEWVIYAVWRGWA